MRASVKSFDILAAPLIPVATGVILGIVFAFVFHPPFIYFLFWCGAFSLFLFAFKYHVFFHHNFVYSLLLSGVFFFVGGMVFLLNQKLTLLAFDEIVTRHEPIVAVVDNIASNVEGKMPHKITLNLSCNSTAFFNKNIILFLRHNFLDIGDIVVLQKFTMLSAAPTDLRNGTLGMVFYEPGKTKLKKYAGFELSFWQWINIYKRNLGHRLMSRMSDLTKSFFGMIFLGHRQREVPENLRESFAFWGVSHYLARSGLHLTIFSYFCFSLFMLLPLGLMWRYFAAILISLIYFFLTHASVSFLRAELMFLMVMFSKVFLRRSQQLHFLILTCLLILLFNPYHLFGLDFQLSFALVFSLLLVSNRLAEGF